MVGTGINVNVIGGGQSTTQAAASPTRNVLVLTSKISGQI